jgi:hypothetical protein
LKKIKVTPSTRFPITFKKWHREASDIQNFEEHTGSGTDHITCRTLINMIISETNKRISLTQNQKRIELYKFKRKTTTTI